VGFAGVTAKAEAGRRQPVQGGHHPARVAVTISQIGGRSAAVEQRLHTLACDAGHHEQRWPAPILGQHLGHWNPAAGQRFDDAGLAQHVAVPDRLSNSIRQFAAEFLIIHVNSSP
jgi:hypothetical protein